MRRHHVARDVERQHVAVVRRTESRGNEAAGTPGMPQAVVGARVVQCVRRAGKLVRPPSAAVRLLLHRGQHFVERRRQQMVRHRSVGRGVDIVAEQEQRVTLRIQFVLPLIHPRQHLRVVLAPSPTHAVGALTEGVGIGVDEQASQGAAHYAAQHVAQMLVLAGKAQVGLDLCRGIAQPHGRYVARDDKGIVVAILELAVVDGRIERVRVAVDEHLPQVRVRDACGRIGDGAFHRFGAEGARRGPAGA